jgi:hypothetical protein
MIQFEYNNVMKRYDVKVPFVLAGEQDMVTIASISENKETKITLHRDLSLKLLKQIILRWDEYEHQMSRELDDLLEDKRETKNEKLIYLAERRQGRWEDIPIARKREDKYLNFSTRAYMVLRTAGIYTVGELVEKSREDLGKYKNCGRKSLNEIEQRLSEVGLTLKQ